MQPLMHSAAKDCFEPLRCPVWQLGMWYEVLPIYPFILCLFCAHQMRIYAHCVHRRYI